MATSHRSSRVPVDSADSKANGQESGNHVPPARKCGFCNDEPVWDATGWLDGRPRIAPCPRCGQVNGNDAT